MAVLCKTVVGVTNVGFSAPQEKNDAMSDGTYLPNRVLRPDTKFTNQNNAFRFNNLLITQSRNSFDQLSSRSLLKCQILLLTKLIHVLNWFCYIYTS